MKITPIATGLAAIGIIVASGPALATGLSYTVSVGGSTAAGSHDFFAETDDVQFSVIPPSPAVPVEMECDAADADGVVNSGSGITDIADITGTGWYLCTGPGGAQTVTHSGTWKLHGTETPVNAAQTDQIDGHIDNVSATIAAPFGTCTFKVAGSADGYFDESTQELVINETGDGSLYVSQIVSGCVNAFSVGDPATFQATYAIDVFDGAANAVSQP